MRTRRWARVGSALVGALAGTILLRLAGATGSTILVIIGASITALLFIRRWLTKLGDRLSDVTAERRELAARLAQCQVAEMANLTFRERLRADTAAAERAADERAAEAEMHAEQRIIEFEALLRREYEETRALELVNFYELGAMNERNGAHDKNQTPAGELIVLSERRRPPTITSRTAGGPGTDIG